MWIYLKKKVIRLKDWLYKMIDQMKQIFQNKSISWLNYVQLERWTKQWVNKYNREYTKYEQFLLSYEDIQMIDSVKGTVSKIYLFLAFPTDIRMIGINLV